jgi:Lar family restriction alleviation protein
MEIKKCPFCGKEPEFHISYGSFGYNPNVYYLKCECGARMGLTDNFSKLDKECKDILIKKWNSRK